MGTPLVTQADSDASMLEGCRNGDPNAQRCLFDTYKDRVFSVALGFLKGDRAAAEDVTQEVFVKVFRAASTFRADARISTWVHRITVNACMDELRRRKRIVLFGDVPSQLEGHVGPHEPMELDARLQAALARMSPKLRMVVLMRHFNDLSYDEIADALGITSGTVASRLSRAHRFLKSELEPAATGRTPVSPDGAEEED
jgi:RNA polymerase sigma-70 factor, ECF subfamily